MLIIFGKGIAATLSIELVMLFLRSGFSVYPVLADGAEDWVVPEMLKQITGRSPLSNNFSPSWKQKQHDFSLALFVNPEEDIVSSLCSETKSDKQYEGVLEYVVDNCDNYFIALGDNCPSNDDKLSVSLDKRIITFQLPLPIEHVVKSMDCLFAEVMRFLLFRAKQNNFSYELLFDEENSSEQSFDNVINWHLQLNNELLKRSLTPKGAGQADLVVESFKVSNSYSENQENSTNVENKKNDISAESAVRDSAPFSEVNEKKHILKLLCIDSEMSDDQIMPLVMDDQVVFKIVKFGSIQIFDITGTRLFPNVSGQTSVGRLADYIIDRLQVLSTNDKL